MKEKGSRNRVVGDGPRERRIRDPIERLPRSVFLRRTNAWTRRRERKRIVPCSNGVDRNESFRFSSKFLVVLVEIRGVEWKCWWFCENETTLVFYANGEGGDVRFFLEKEKNPRSLDDERFVVVGGTGSAGHTSDFSGFKRRKVGFEY